MGGTRQKLRNERRLCSPSLYGLSFSSLQSDAVNVEFRALLQVWLRKTQNPKASFRFPAASRRDGFGYDQMSEVQAQAPGLQTTTATIESTGTALCLHGCVKWTTVAIARIGGAVQVHSWHSKGSDIVDVFTPCSLDNGGMRQTAVHRKT